MGNRDTQTGLQILDRRTALARVTIGLYLVSWALVLLVQLAEAVGVYDFETAPESVSLMVVGLVLLLAALVSLASFVVIGIWIYRAHANLWSASGEGLQFKPGWAIGWYFIPIANLFKPFQAMRELSASSHGYADRYGDAPQGELPSWWAGWIAGNALSMVSLRIAGIGGEASTPVTDGIDALSTVCMLASAWFLLKIIEEVNRAQQTSLGVQETFA
ncbi:MAG: DUF4328 domain-containing protein [Novosphingobium sp.]|nr:DUF4328 domain-containing protein [Novosphingobium sp.]MCP5402942.1 DUF4328 domain-containing protein [Novosphingobium sp.]